MRVLAPFTQELVVGASLRITIAALMLAMPFGASVLAQTTKGDSALRTRSAWTTRDSLTARLSHGGPDSIAAAQRLALGDFHPGDRILLAVEGEPALSDTFLVHSDKVVAADPVLRLPNIDQDIPLQGVLRSELEPRLDSVLGHYIKHPVVRAQSLLLVQVAGAVRYPGSYTVPADEQLGTVISRAGDMGPSADPGKIVIKRQGSVLVSSKQVQAAVVQRESLDQLGLQAADEVEVGERSQSAFLRILGLSATLVGLGVGIVVLFRH